MLTYRVVTSAPQVVRSLPQVSAAFYSNCTSSQLDSLTIHLRNMLDKLDRGQKMSKPLGTVWPLEQHTAKKHEILRRYFEAWLPIMSSRNGRVLYIDGFAGPGKYSQGEDGSPLIILKAARDHTYKVEAELMCLFVEADTDRYEHLKSVLAETSPSLPKNVAFEAICGTFDEHLAQVFDELQKQKEQIAPTLAFIDPFGFTHTPFSTVAKILENKQCEVLVNFMYEEVNRFLSLPNHSGDYDRLFGTREWREALGKPTPDTRRRFLHDLYLKQLKTVAKYARSFEMLNQGNRTDYFLFFASNNLRGLEKMKESMWRVDPDGQFQFSDFTTDVSDQLLLFKNEPDYDTLRSMIRSRFGGREVEIVQLGDWVISETPFLRTHIKTKVLAPMEKEGALSVPNPKQGRRSCTYPEGTVVRFS